MQPRYRDVLYGGWCHLESNVATMYQHTCEVAYTFSCTCTLTPVLHMPGFDFKLKWTRSRGTERNVVFVLSLVLTK